MTFRVHPTDGTINVQTTSTCILDANAKRKYALIVNISNTNIDISLDGAAVAGKGIRLYPYGGYYEIDDRNIFNGAIYGIHEGSGSKAVTIVEGQ